MCVLMKRVKICLLKKTKFRSIGRENLTFRTVSVQETSKFRVITKSSCLKFRFSQWERSFSCFYFSIKLYILIFIYLWVRYHTLTVQSNIVFLLQLNFHENQITSYGSNFEFVEIIWMMLHLYKSENYKYNESFKHQRQNCSVYRLINVCNAFFRLLEFSDFYFESFKILFQEKMCLFTYKCLNITTLLWIFDFLLYDQYEKNYFYFVIHFDLTFFTLLYCSCFFNIWNNFRVKYTSNFLPYICTYI